MATFRDRFIYWARLLRRAVWPLFTIPLGALGLLINIRDEFLPSTIARKLRVLDWLPAFPWYYWVLLITVMIIIALLEGSYRDHRELMAKVASATDDDALRLREIEAQEEHTAALRRQTHALERERTYSFVDDFMTSARRKKRVAMGLERDPDALKISIGEEQTQPRNDYIIRTVCARVENVDSAHFISNCKIVVNANSADYQLVDTFTLNPTEHLTVPVAIHHESEIDKFIHIIVSNIGKTFDVKLPLTGALITLKATSAETKAAQLVCRLFVDDTGRLRIEKA
jgi:hypothetical protein